MDINNCNEPKDIPSRAEYECDEANFDISISICKDLFDYCQKDEEKVTAVNTLIQRCHEHSIKLNYIIHLIDSQFFLQKYSTNSFFNFDLFLTFCQTFYSDPKELKNVGQIIFSNCWHHSTDFQFDFIAFCIENNHIINLLENCVDNDLNREIPEWNKCLNDSKDSSLICWKFLALYQILFELVSIEKLYPKVEAIFQSPLENCPDLLIFGLFKEGFNLETKFIRSVMIKATKKMIYPATNTLYYSNSSLIIQKLWFNNSVNTLSPTQKLLLDSMVDLYNTSSGTKDQTKKLLRILEITQDLTALNYILNDSSYLFVIDLAAVASRREYLKLDKWINDKLSSIGKPFADACKYYVQERLNNADILPDICMSFHIETFGIIISCLKNYYNKKIYSNDMKDVFKIYAELETQKSNIANLNGGKDSSTSASVNENGSHSCNQLSGNCFDEETQKKSDDYLKAIFNQFSTRDDHETFTQIFDFFEKLKHSNKKQDNEVFECLIQTLLKELNYLVHYPTNELKIMGELIGGIINRNLVENNLFSLILQKLYFIINASKKDSNLLHFVERALRRCQPRLQQYPALLEKLCMLELPPLTSYTKIKKNNTSKESSNIELDFKERLNFILNNLDNSNVQTFASQLKKDCDNLQFTEILSDCLTYRAINETNHHQLFLDLLELINVNTLYETIIQKTYNKIKYHLSKIEISDHSKKLYSAGQWLGSITLQRNKPILSLYLDLHTLIIEAEYKELLFYVIPFIVRILNSCALSKVFKPPNPWLMSLLKQLIEIYKKPETKFKIKFEIENLYKTLELDLNEHIILYKSSNKEIIPRCNEYFKSFDKDLNIQNEMINFRSADSKIIHQQIEEIDNSSSIFDIVEQIKNLLHNLKISPQVKNIHCSSDIVEIVKQQIVKSIQEWITSISKTFNMFLKSIEILIKKDFTLESDSEIIEKAAINMTQYVLAGYILINCKDSLPATIAEKLRLFLKCFSLPENSNKNIVEDVVIIIVRDNIDFCISFIQKLFIEKGTEEILKRINLYLEKRMKSKDNGQKNVYTFTSETSKFHIPTYLNVYNYFDISSLINNNNLNQTSIHQPEGSNINQQPFFSEYTENIKNNGILINFPTVDLKIKRIFLEWVEFFHGRPNNYQIIHNELLKTGFFKNEESLYYFFKMCFEICYEKCKLVLQSNNISLYHAHFECHTFLDPFTYLVLVLIKYETIELKINVLDRVLTDLSTKVHLEQKKNFQQFYPLCFYRVVVLFYLEFINDITVYQNRLQYQNLKNPDQYLNIQLSLMQIFYDFLKSISPLNVPSFTFFWLEFISHRSFIGKCLNDRSSTKLWKLYYCLLRDLLEFEKPFFQSNEIKCDSFKLLHKGTVKLFFLLLHDFPDFFTQFGFLICDILPHNAFQFRNIVLSAFPSTVNLPDPVSSNLTMDNFNDILQKYEGEFSTESPFKIHIDVYFKTGKLFHLNKLPPYFESAKSLQIQIEYINKILYSISELVLKENRNVNLTTISKELSIDMIKCLLEFFDVERRYYLFNAMVNHLRYPNIETKYFICLLLYFFKEYPTFKEVILRVLLERSFVRRPRPWGLLYILKEISLNPIYNFRDLLNNLNYQEQSFIREKLGLPSS